MQHTYNDKFDTEQSEHDALCFDPILASSPSPVYHHPQNILPYQENQIPRHEQHPPNFFLTYQPSFYGHVDPPSLDYLANYNSLHGHINSTISTAPIVSYPYFHSPISDTQRKDNFSADASNKTPILPASKRKFEESDGFPNKKLFQAASFTAGTAAPQVNGSLVNGTQYNPYNAVNEYTSQESPNINVKTAVKNAGLRPLIGRFKKDKKTAWQGFEKSFRFQRGGTSPHRVVVELYARVTLQKINVEVKEELQDQGKAQNVCIDTVEKKCQSTGKIQPPSDTKRNSFQLSTR